MITVYLSTIDHHREKRTYKTLAGARAFAFKYVGTNAEFGQLGSLGGGYAVSSDGVCKVEVSGCTLKELFSLKEGA